MKTLFTPNAKQPRKHLAQVIGTILGGTKPTYLGAPSMAYQIGPVTLTRDWTVAWPAGLPARDVDLIEAVAAQEGYELTRTGQPENTLGDAASEAPNESSGEAVREDVGLTLVFPTTGWDERTQANLVAMLASKRALIGKALGLPGAAGGVHRRPGFLPLVHKDARTGSRRSRHATAGRDDQRFGKGQPRFTQATSGWQREVRDALLPAPVGVHRQPIQTRQAHSDGEP